MVVTKTAARYNEGKPKLSYFFHFPVVIKAIARIMEFGATKYEDGNWKLGGKPDKEYLDSMLRHLDKYFNEGEKYDQDSGCSHIAQAVWNLMALHQLNHSDEIIDEELFSERKAYWEEKKKNG